MSAFFVRVALQSLFYPLYPIPYFRTFALLSDSHIMSILVDIYLAFEPQGG